MKGYFRGLVPGQYTQAEVQSPVPAVGSQVVEAFKTIKRKKQKTNQYAAIKRFKKY